MVAAFRHRRAESDPIENYVGLPVDEVALGNVPPPQGLKCTNARGSHFIHPLSTLSTCSRVRPIEAELHLFLTSALDGCEWSASRPAGITPGESPHSRSGRARKQKNVLSNLSSEQRIIQPTAWPLCRVKCPSSLSTRDTFGVQVQASATYVCEVQVLVVAGKIKPL
jgi:hypothetical protein